MEGPSLVILIEEANKFVGQRVLKCTTSLASVDCDQLARKKLVDLKSFGKHLLLQFERATYRIHFLMFGSYWIDKPHPEKTPKLTLEFSNGQINFYSCSIQPVTQPIEEIYDWRIDLMSDQWDENFVLRQLKGRDDELLCDLLLDQTLFAGSGNIFKNEVLFNLQLQPGTKLKTLTARERRALVREMRAYAFRFYEWKKAYVLRKNWRIYRRRYCAVCETAAVMEKTGQLQRVSFYCPRCQKLRKRLPAARK